MRYYCTYFDSHFLPRALALHASLRRHGGEFRLWALCMDDASYQRLQELALPDVEPIRLGDFETGDIALAQARGNRSALEYYFTCTPTLPLYVMAHHPDVDLITYLDADLYFYSSPEPLFAELGEASIGIIPHRFSARVQDRERCGIFNVGWISFRRDAQGLACLHHWREQCLEWCYARWEDGRYADQKYLDVWPELYSHLRILSHPGANLGPWNLAGRRISDHGGEITVDGQPLIFYHFTSFMRVAPWLYNTNLSSWRVRPNAVVRRRIVAAYIAELEAGACGPDAGSQAANLPVTLVQSVAEGLPAKLRRKLRGVMRILGGLITQDHLVVVRQRVL